ncbi:retrovirus-related pol polyprotein from transposon TNT 1-94 [Tanacetum coccineum]
MSQHLKSLGRSLSRSKILRPSKRFFPPCIHCGCTDHLSNECLYYPICGLCGSYNHDTNGHNRIISLEREINPRNPPHTFKRCEACGSSTHTTTDRYDIEWFKRGKAFQAKKAKALKSTRVESSNANRSKTPTKSNDVSFIEPYECPELVVLETEVSSDQNGQTAQNDQYAQTNEILNDDYIEDTLVQNTIPIPNSSLSIPSMVTPAPQDKHIELVNIIGNPGAGMLIKAMAKQLSAASAHECLFVDFLSEEEPKKVSKAPQHPGWVDAIQDELNQFAKNKVGTLVSASYGKTIIGSKWVFRNKRDETRIVIKNKARLVAQGYNQQEGIDYDETFAHCKT